jgi:dihydrofolate reductase
MRRIIIVAAAENGCIGRDNALPWRFLEDLRMFKRETTGHPIIMGRKTFESMPGPLPNRFNVVITHQPRESDDPSVAFVSSLNEAFERCAGREKAFVAGGAEIYRLALPEVDELWLTRIPGMYECDTYFPEYPPGAAWELYHEQRGEQVTFQRYRRIRNHATG